MYCAARVLYIHITFVWLGVPNSQPQHYLADRNAIILYFAWIRMLFICQYVYSNWQWVFLRPLVLKTGTFSHFFFLLVIFYCYIFNLSKIWSFNFPTWNRLRSSRYSLLRLNIFYIIFTFSRNIKNYIWVKTILVFEPSNSWVKPCCQEYCLGFILFYCCITIL